jgi:hypothetical protein
MDPEASRIYFSNKALVNQIRKKYEKSKSTAKKNGRK